MENIGQRIKEISYMKGLKQTDLAKKRGVTRQTISHDFRQKRLSVDILKWYAETFNMSVEELTMLDKKQTNEDSENWKEKYFESLEIINKLMLVVNQNGIKVNFKYVISLPRVGADIFFAHANTANNNYGL